MGCTSSTEHPSIYNETTGKQKQTNGHVIKTPVTNPNYMRGDFSQFQLAKHNREKHQKDRRSEIFRKADEMSERIIEERELLSLGTRSRGTSRATSRTASPNSNKRQLKEEHTAPMTPVAELSRGGSHRREESAERDQVDIVDGESNNNQPKSVKKHKKGKQTKSKNKGKKHRKVRGKKSKTEKVSFKDHGDSDDSGMEDNNNIQPEEEEDDEDIENVNTEPETEVTRGDEDKVENNSGLLDEKESDSVKTDKEMDESHNADAGSVPIQNTPCEPVETAGPEVTEAGPTDNVL